ncbi:prion-like-(Q/N-rich) domain-bearing protein 25 [Pomacea canaliculata]|uniref:prion-like-(Q/N-rich) domain-bearing protein 25 n=1 Tax=Pomacea canaliculata TaxID=400727 RepID=UPI000D732D09|nr:prion-like-(Q/N-rich) domain-bearing protein 25 [Pomacea canaliculata]XP_025082197.1 prion-like-(Q/N-rich) domain-bearing protein 25 [Pomacea canaliculata]
MKTPNVIMDNGICKSRKRRICEAVLVVVSLTCLLVPCHAAIDGHCITDANCPPNSQCRPRGCDGYVCTCKVDYVPSMDKEKCQRAIKVGEICSLEDRCLSRMAKCINEQANNASSTRRCTCEIYFRTVESQQTCTFPEKLVIGEACALSTECADPHALCKNGECTCKEGMRKKTQEEYWVKPQDVTLCVISNYQLRECNGTEVTPAPPPAPIAAGEPCTAKGQCVANAECTDTVGGVCKCGADYYNDQGVCNKRRPAGSACFGSGQCVANSDCSSTMGGTCDCMSGYYENGGVCVESIRPGFPCTSYGQCVTFAECDLGKTNLCVCIEGYWNNKTTCAEAIKAGQPCGGFEQCIANAECTTNTGGTCDCNQGFFNDRGYCKPVKPAGQSCTGMASASLTLSVKVTDAFVNLATSATVAAVTPSGQREKRARAVASVSRTPSARRRPVPAYAGVKLASMTSRAAVGARFRLGTAARGPVSAPPTPSARTKCARATRALWSVTVRASYRRRQANSVQQQTSVWPTLAALCLDLANVIPAFSMTRVRAPH